MRKTASLTLSLILNILLIFGISKLIVVKEKEKLEEEIVISLSPKEINKKPPSSLVKEEKDIRQGKRNLTVKKRKATAPKGKGRKRAKRKTKKYVNFNRKKKRKKEERKETKLKGPSPIKEAKEEIGKEEKKLQETKAGKGEKRSLKEKDKKEKPFSSFNLEAYKNKVIEVIEENKFYPPLARRLGIEGEVKVLLTIGRKGELLKVETLSGNRILREATVKILKRCNFPPLPKSFKGEEVRLELSICYKLY